MYQGKGHMLDIYAMDDNKNLYKVFSENYVRDVDEEWCIYNVAGNEFIYTWDFVEGEHIDGAVSTWPVPSFEELQTYLHCEKTGESRNCDSEALCYEQQSHQGYDDFFSDTACCHEIYQKGFRLSWVQIHIALMA